MIHPHLIIFPLFILSILLNLDFLIIGGFIILIMMMEMTLSLNHEHNSIGEMIEIIWNDLTNKNEKE